VSALGQRFLDEVNATVVSPEMLGEVMQMHADMLPADRQVHEVRMIRLFELLKAKGLKGRRHSDMAMAIDFRLSALAHLISEHDVRGWTLPAEPGVEYVHFDVLRAAADEPVIENDERQAGFEPERFRLRVLALSDPKGTA
jgi:hypothetical protein